MTFPGASYPHIESYSFMPGSTLLYREVGSRGSHHAESSTPGAFSSPFPLPGGSPPKVPNCMISKQRGPHSQMRRNSPSVQALEKPHCPARIFFLALSQIRKVLAYSTHFSSMMVWPLLLVSSMMSFSSSGSKTCGTESLRVPTNKG